MLLTQEKLNEVMSVEKQKEAIKKIREAPDGMVVFTSFMNDESSASIYKTLMSLAGVKYHESLWISRGKVKWVKGSLHFNYFAA